MADKGLKKDALGFVSSVVIGVASTAPGYSLAAVLTLVVAAVGVQAPAVLILAFVPMLFIAASYYYMNRADPDCGTTFSWVTRAMGPWAGWISGWAIVVADIIVMANLAQIAGLYGFLLFGWQSAADSTLAVTLVGVIWIVVMTAICVYGIELSARTQVGLLSAEVITLTLFAGADAIAKDDSGDALGLLGTQVLGVGLDKLVIIAVLTSAAASTQTTILPTARTPLSMARAGAMPERLGVIHPRFLTPHISTILMGVFSILWYVGLTLVSENILFDSIAALGLMIAFYYGLTGFACAIFYRRELTRSVKSFLLVGVAPVLGGLVLTYVLVKSCIDLSKPANSESGDSWLGIGPPLVIGIGFLLFGVVLMVLWRADGHRDFFDRRPETADPGSLEGQPPAQPAETAGVA